MDEPSAWLLYQEALDEIARQQEELLKKEKEIEALQKQISDLQSQNANLRNTIDQQSLTIANQQNQISQYIQQVNNLQIRIEELEDANDELSHNNSTLASQLATAAATVAALTAEVADKTATIAALTATGAALASLAGDRRRVLQQMSASVGGTLMARNAVCLNVNFGWSWAGKQNGAMYYYTTLPGLNFPAGTHVFMYRHDVNVRVYVVYFPTQTYASPNQYNGVATTGLYGYTTSANFDLVKTLGYYVYSNNTTASVYFDIHPTILVRLFNSDTAASMISQRIFGGEVSWSLSAASRIYDAES